LSQLDLGDGDCSLLNRPSFRIAQPTRRAAMSASQRSPRDGGDDAAARLRRRTDELQGSDAPHEKPSDADLRLETVDSDPADNARRIVDALERG
jgi:hypothetical protein